MSHVHPSCERPHRPDRRGSFGVSRGRPLPPGGDRSDLPAPARRSPGWPLTRTGTLRVPRRVRDRLRAAVLLLASGVISAGAAAQDPAYFITYTHHMEEPGELEVALKPVIGSQRGGPGFVASVLEFEYGATGWWTTELYIAGQTTRRQGSVFTGVRWENRFRLLLEEHLVNPVLYVEYEDVNGADKVMLDVVGHDVEADHREPIAASRREREREVETKLILSSQLDAWNVAGNIVAARNLAGEPWEFGYAVGASRPLAEAARPEPCSFCPENFALGIELYGGLGDSERFGLQDTSHYLAPVVAWTLPSGLTLRLSPGFGLNHESHRIVVRLGLSYEIGDFGAQVAHALGRSRT